MHSKLELELHFDDVQTMPAALRAKAPVAPKKNAPVCVGSGFVALDLILIGRDECHPSFTFAGGSCGNVLAILAFLGWDAVPVIRLKDDDEATKLVADLEKWSVNTRFVLQEPSGVTPVVVQRILTSINGDPYHRFEWKCPTTGILLPRYRPLPQQIAIEVSTQLPKPKAFYFDRVAKSALLLAERSRARGALVFFEPSAMGDPQLFNQCLAVADVIKYSAERLPNPPRFPEGFGPRLEIQTLGSEGLRYRFHAPEVGRGAWKRLPAVSISGFKDAAGAGDWCSAGIIDILARKGRTSFENASAARLEFALKRGQALAAVNCRYEGARGGMYQMDRTALEAAAKSVLGSGKAVREGASKA